VQRSLLIDVIVGATAVGGGDLTVVVDVEVESVVLFDVDSVTIGSANVAEQAATIMIPTIVFFIFMFSPCGSNNKNHKNT
jgi:hypothetical protein